jgi:hypothetical protein
MDQGTERVVKNGTDRLLSLEVCPQRFGFAVFDGSATLLDWGTKNYRGCRARQQTALRERISALLRLSTPTVLVIRFRNSSSTKANKKTLSAVATIRTAAETQSVKVHSMSANEVRRFFSAHNCRTKNQIASQIVHWFVELSPKLPSARKAWQSEAHNSVVFDAVATGITFLTRDRSHRLSVKK